MKAREMLILEDSVVDDVICEHARSGRAIREILETLRDEGHVAIPDDAGMDDCVRQCTLALTVGL